MDEGESFEKALLLAGLDSLREIGGDALVQVLLGQAGTMEFTKPENLPDRIPIREYLRYRDTLLDFLQDSFRATAFQAGQILVRSLQSKRGNEIKRLISQFKYAPNKLPAIGQAAVLAAKGNPGIVRAAMRGETVLVITIENCPECRGLRQETPICFLNQGLITEFADVYLGLQVKTQETRCAALGQSCCDIEVTIVK